MLSWRVFQPPKDSAGEEKGQAGLTTLFPGQRRRISHLVKQGKEVRPECSPGTVRPVGWTPLVTWCPAPPRSCGGVGPARPVGCVGCSCGVAGWHWQGQRQRTSSRFGCLSADPLGLHTFLPEAEEEEEEEGEEGPGFWDWARRSLGLGRLCDCLPTLPLYPAGPEHPGSLELWSRPVDAPARAA